MKQKHLTQIRHFAAAAAVLSAPHYYTTQAHADEVSTNLDVKALIEERINGASRKKLKTLEQERRRRTSNEGRCRRHGHQQDGAHQWTPNKK